MFAEQTHLIMKAIIFQSRIQRPRLTAAFLRPPQFISCHALAHRLVSSVRCALAKADTHHNKSMALMINSNTSKGRTTQNSNSLMAGSFLEEKKKKGTYCGKKNSQSNLCFLTLENTFKISKPSLTIFMSFNSFVLFFKARFLYVTALAVLELAL